ncbi:MAG: condensation domain-containing protein, partial [Chloroflexota bacterium]
MNNKGTIVASYPLSPLQQGIFFHSLYNPTSGAYTIQIVCTLWEDLNVAAFKKACQQVVNRHAALRTSFRWKDSEYPVQDVHEEAVCSVQAVDLRGLSALEQQNYQDDYLYEDR